MEIKAVGDRVLYWQKDRACVAILRSAPDNSDACSVFVLDGAMELVNVTFSAKPWDSCWSWPFTGNPHVKSVAAPKLDIPPVPAVNSPKAAKPKRVQVNYSALLWGSFGAALIQGAMWILTHHS